ncbi:hypothetical protein [Polycladidibacter stylochi]|uniref:hypothetical protein n=1 Tax=Polycladidibacter stylochi TaxID=1807766 RepID=UPI000833D508|nr:hypothetical protein [Pseudovibrio stylochi]
MNTIFKKLSILLASSLALASCMKTVKLSDENHKKLASQPIIVLENANSDEHRQDSTMQGQGLIAMAIIGTVNLASGTYNDMAAAPRAKIAPLPPLREQIVNHLKANHSMQFAGTR